MMNVLGVDVKDPQQIFTHLEKDTNVARTFLIETMEAFAHKHAGDPLFSELLVATMVPIDLATAAYLRTNQGIEQNRIDRLRKPYIDRPILAISWGKLPDGSDEVTIVDGNHRFVKKAERGDKNIMCFVFRRDLWEHFMLPDHLSARLVREGFLDRVSNIIERENNGNH